MGHRSHHLVKLRVWACIMPIEQTRRLHPPELQRDAHLIEEDWDENTPASPLSRFSFHPVELTECCDHTTITQRAASNASSMA